MTDFTFHTLFPLKFFTYSVQFEMPTFLHTQITLIINKISYIKSYALQYLDVHNKTQKVEILKQERFIRSVYVTIQVGWGSDSLSSVMFFCFFYNFTNDVFQH